MRLVVDTNVIVSGALKESSWPGQTLRWLARYGGLLKSEETELETSMVLARPRIAAKIAPVFATQMKQLFSAAELVTITTTIRECRDPKDDKFLALALDGHADVIVSGDLDLLVLDTFRGIPIVTPAAFGGARLVRGDRA